MFQVGKTRREIICHLFTAKSLGAFFQVSPHTGLRAPSVMTMQQLCSFDAAPPEDASSNLFSTNRRAARSRPRWRSPAWQGRSEEQSEPHPRLLSLPLEEGERLWTEPRAVMVRDGVHTHTHTNGHTCGGFIKVINHNDDRRRLREENVWAGRLVETTVWGRRARTHAHAICIHAQVEQKLRSESPS